MTNADSLFDVEVAFTGSVHCTKSQQKGRFLYCSFDLHGDGNSMGFRIFDDDLRGHYL